MDTLQQAKDDIRENFEEGSDCPCCGQFVKLYKRKLSSAMAIALIEIYKRDYRKAGFFHVEDYFKSLPHLPSSIRGDFSKLRYWDLIRKEEGEREDGSNRVGKYRITDKGRAFVRNHISVSSHVFLFDNKLKGFSEKEVLIGECLGSKFNYNELMAGI